MQCYGKKQRGNAFVIRATQHIPPQQLRDN